VNRRVRGPVSITATVDFGTARLVPDADNPGGCTLFVDGTPQSYVDTNRPTRLEFEYMRRLAAVVDEIAPAGARIDALHLGGGALTLPRYVAVTRPGSAQRVVERDSALTAFVRRTLPLPRGANVRVRSADARDAIGRMAAARFDLVVTDVYRPDGRMPGGLGTTEATTAIARLLRPGGWYAVNLADGSSLRFSRATAATLRAVFPGVCLLAEPAVLKGRRFGNLVAVAGPSLPIDALAADAARDPFPARLLHDAELTRFIAGARPLTDAAAEDSPEPPRELFGAGAPLPS
jgi:spermidine synthase